MGREFSTSDLDGCLAIRHKVYPDPSYVMHARVRVRDLLPNGYLDRDDRVFLRACRGFDHGHVFLGLEIRRFIHESFNFLWGLFFFGRCFFFCWSFFFVRQVMFT